MELGVGEALVSTLKDKGEPSIVQRTLIRPPSSRLGPLTVAERKEIIAVSPVKGAYEERDDRDSAHEMLQRKAEAEEAEEEAAELEEEDEGEYDRNGEFRIPRRESSRTGSGSSRRQSVSETFYKSLARSLARELPRILRGIFGRR
jgi:hypothetical protein